MRSRPLPWLLALCAAAASAQAPDPAGEEFQINSYTTDRQSRSAAAMDNSGNFVVVWQSYGIDGDRNGIQGQRFDAAGGLLGGEFQVNSFTTSFQHYPTVAADGIGNFVVLWQSTGPDGDSSSIQGQRYDAAGAALGAEFQVNAYTTDRQDRPAAAMADNGDFVVVWQSGSSVNPGPDGDSYGIQGRRFDSLGGSVGGEFQVNVFTTGFQRSPTVAIGAQGSFMVTWTSVGQDGDGYSVHGRRFDSAGGPLSSEFLINSWTTGSQTGPAVTTDPQGRFVVVWQGDGPDGTPSSVLGQRFDAAGQPTGAEFQINSYTFDSQGPATVAADDAGNFMVVWHSGFPGPDGNGRSVQGQGFDAAGATVGGEFQVNSYTTDQQGFPRIVIDGPGVFVVWQSGFGQDGENYGIFGQRYTFSGVIFADGFESGDTSRWSVAQSSLVSVDASR